MAAQNFPLKEKGLPDLCADRLDYSLRLFSHYLKLSSNEVDYFLEELTVENGNWLFKTLESAKKYAELFLKLNREYMAGLPSAAMFATVGGYLKYGLRQKYLLKEDLYRTDKWVLEELSKHLPADQGLRELFERMNNKVGFKNDPQDYDEHIFCKSRVVDPLFSSTQGLKRLSEVETSWAEVLSMESKPKEYFIKFFD